MEYLLKVFNCCGSKTVELSDLQTFLSEKHKQLMSMFEQLEGRIALSDSETSEIFKMADNLDLFN